MYYHKECFEKKELKEELREVMSGFPKRDINISLSKAIDENSYHIGYVEYVAKNKLSLFQNAYGLLYQLKIEKNYDEYIKQEGHKVAFEINSAVKSMDIDADAFQFEYKPTKNRRLNIY